MLFDEVLDLIGEGIFQRFAIFVCGLSVLAEAIATTSVPFAMILVSCDLKVTLDQLLGLNAVLFIAMLLSAYWLGGVSDMSGRKYILSTTSILTFVGCFVASFSQCVIMLFISLFLLGLGLGGNHSATRIFIIEIVPKSIRGSRLIILEIFSAIGFASAIGLSRLFLPSLASSVLGNNVRLNSWRLLFGLSGSLSIFSACLMSVFPASPRWLLGKKQEDDAVDILRKIFALNKVEHEESFPKIQLDPLMFVSVRREPQIYQCRNAFVRSLRSISAYTKHLFTRKFIKTTLAAIAISVIFFDGIVIMNIWLSLILFTRNINDCTLRGAYSAEIESMLSLEVCNQAVLENLFKMNSYLSLASFLVILVYCFADRIPRKFILMMSSFLSGSALIVMAFVSHETTKFVLPFVIMAFMFIAEVMFRIILLESYPTVLRCTAYNFIKIFSKLNLIFLILFFRVPCIWAFFSFGILFIMFVRFREIMVLKCYSASDGLLILAVLMALIISTWNFNLLMEFTTGYHITEECGKVILQQEIPVLEDNGFCLSKSFGQVFLLLSRNWTEIIVIGYLCLLLV